MDNLPQEVIDLIASFVERNDHDEHTDERAASYHPIEKRDKKAGEANDERSHTVSEEIIPMLQDDDLKEPSVLDSEFELNRTRPPTARCWPLCSISRAWNASIERLTFHTLRITSDELDHFRRIVRGTRRAALKTLVFVVMFSPASKIKGRAHSQRFTRALNSLFEILSGWEAEGLIEGCLELGIQFMHSKEERDFGPELDQEVEARLLKDLLEYRTGKNYIHLLDPQKLPVLKRVVGLYYYEDRKEYDLRIQYSSLGHIVEKLPFISCMEWTLQELDNMMMVADQTDEHRLNNLEALDERAQSHVEEEPENDIMEGPTNGGGPAGANVDASDLYSFATCCQMVDNRRRENRLAFAQSLSLIHPPEGSWLELHMYKNEDMERNDHPGPVYDIAHVFDPLSNALRKFTANLRDFDYTGLIDSTLFWPKSELEDDLPYWPRLEDLSIVFDPQTPCGNWYITSTGNVPPPAYFDGDSLGEPVNRYMNPLLLALAKAVNRMPALQLIWFRSGYVYGAASLRFKFRIEYYAPGQVSPDLQKSDAEYADDVNVRRLYFDFGHWVPGAEVLAALRNMGADFHGSELIERFKSVESDGEE